MSSRAPIDGNMSLYHYLTLAKLTGLQTLTLVMPTEPLRAVGSQVFDMPTQAIQTITSANLFVEEGFVTDDDIRDTPTPDERQGLRVMVFYTVTGPDNPTGDGAFNGGSRCDFEVCDVGQTLELQY